MEICHVAYALTAKKLRKGGISFADNSSVDKWHGGGLGDLLRANDDDTDHTNAPEGGVRFFPFCPETVEHGPVFNLIIHKLTDMDAEESRLKLGAIEQYLAAHSETLIVDPVTSVRKITSRWRACECLQHILDGSVSRGGVPRWVPFKQPAYCLVESIETFTQQLAAKDMHFPVICKPLEACGTPESHKMVVLVSAADVTTMLCPFPCLVQQYHNHDATFLKVYVLGDDVHVYRRTSLPNLNLTGAAQTTARDERNAVARDGADISICSVVFDSRCCYPTLADFHSGPSVTDISMVKKQQQLLLQQEHTKPNGAAEACTDTDSGTASTAIANARAQAATQESIKRGAGAALPEIPADVIERCRASAAMIRDEFSLSLFGFDAIIPSEQRVSGGGGGGDAEVGGDPVGGASGGSGGFELYVIDVNFFPSYKELTDFPQRLRSFLRHRAGLPPWRNEEQQDPL